MIPLRLPFSYLIELFLYFRGKIEIHHGGEVLHKEIIHHDPYIGGNQFILVGTDNLCLITIFDVPFFKCQDIIGALYPLHDPFLHVLTVHDSGDGWCIGGRTTDTQLFHLAYKRCLRKSCRTLCETLRGGGLKHTQHFTFPHGWQHAFIILTVLIVRSLEVDTKESVELDHFTVGNKFTVGI